MTITKKEILKLGELAKIRISESEVEELQKQLNHTSSRPTRYGWFIAITDKYLAVSANAIDSVFIYKRYGTEWKFLRVIASQVEEGIQQNLVVFGRRISITNEYLLIGNSHQSSAQGAWLFGKNTGGTDAWGLLKSFTFPGVNDPSESTENNEQFGFSNSIDGDYLVIGANRSKAYNGLSSITTAGMTFVYYRHQGGIDNWGLQQKIHAQNTDGTHDIVEDARFGNRVNIKGKKTFPLFPTLSLTILATKS